MLANQTLVIAKITFHFYYSVSAGIGEGEGVCGEGGGCIGGVW